MRNKLKSRLGFTMAELLIVVAIIGVLGGVGFIAVQSHQRTLAQTERDTIAKELFVAAQNHLVLARSEGYTNAPEDTYGTPGNAVDDAGNSDVYYFYSGDGFKEGSLLNRMLPFGAIDETVRAGHYIIRYQPKAAVVLDVFYWTTNAPNDPYSRFNCNDLKGSDYATLMNSYRGIDKHKQYSGGTLGWFGGEENVATGVSLKAPDIEVDNGERLLVTVRDNNADATGLSLKLIITGQSSKAMAALPLSATGGGKRVSVSGNAYTVVLDDITSANQLHFAQINGDGDFEFLKNATGNIPFIPGENITVQAVSYSNTALTSVAYSGEVTTNSLFAETSQRTLEQAYAELTHAEGAGNPAETDAWITAKIGCFRHLENLDARISWLDHNDLSGKLSIAYAMQTADLDWKDFFGGSATIYDIDGNEAKQGCFVPVSPSTCTMNNVENVTLTYDGKGVVSTTAEGVTSYSYTPHSVTGISVDVTDGNAGMFGTLKGGGISNLDLIGFNVKSASGSAGALAGTLDGTQVSNVRARESEAPATATTDVTATSGSAGGLIGSMSGGSVERCAAALTVSGGANAGGLIGAVSGSASVKESYSGGHTEAVSLGDGTVAVRYSTANYNVTATGTAGGLIGSAGMANVERCYATCSAKGATAGGLVGAASGTIANSYCTGLVSGTTTEGAFAGSLTGTASGCRYYEIINERPSAATGYETLAALGVGNSDGITALDESVESYNSFVGGAIAWNGATPYLENLKDYYQGKYNLMTVDQLGAATKTATADKTDFVATHYGDWPVPETFIVNEKQA